MAGNLQPLDQKFPIVTADGRPTLYFIQWAQQKQIDISAGITAEQALAIIEQYLADHQLQAGTGISISPSGNLSDAPTIAAEVQAILDQITTTQGSILFRGAADWQALAPGTAGQVLKSNGAGADPSWGAGGGGSAWANILVQNIAAPTANIDVNVVGYSEILVQFLQVTTSVSGRRSVIVSVDNGVSYFNGAADYLFYGALGTGGTTNALQAHGTNATAARSGPVRLSGVNTNGSPKFALVGDSNMFRTFTASNLPITNIRIFNDAGGNLTGGTVVVQGQ